MDFLQTNDSKIDVANRETARLIKNSFQKIGNGIESNKYKSIELSQYRKEIWKRRDIIPHFMDGMVMFFHWISSNHSKYWVLPFLWIIIISGFTTYNLDFSISFNYISKYMYILTPQEDFCENSPLLFFNKISLGYLYYQFVTTVRKDTK
jgi:hypothetical protein